MVEGFCEVQFECLDNGDGICFVFYVFIEFGDYNINIFFVDIYIFGFLFKVYVVFCFDVFKVKCLGFGLEWVIVGEVG